jgi:hypothetical protein
MHGIGRLAKRERFLRLATQQDNEDRCGKQDNDPNDVIAVV